MNPYQTPPHHDDDRQQTNLRPAMRVAMGRFLIALDLLAVLFIVAWMTSVLAPLSTTTLTTIWCVLFPISMLMLLAHHLFWLLERWFGK